MPLVAGPPGLIARLLRANPCCVRERRRELDVNLSSPANIGIVSYFEARARSPRSVSAARACASASPESVTNPYYDLGAHPELVERLWDRLTVKLPADCRWIVYGAPALVRPSSGIVFAFAGGTQTYALRLPTREREAALRAGARRSHQYPAYPALEIEASTLDLDDIGEEWVFGGWFEGEEDWCLAAYRFAQAPN
jgi:hypothetical protein